MKRLICLLFLGLFSLSALSQEGFVLSDDVKKDVIPFESINNLILIEVEVNSTALKFILDTGSTRNIIFDFHNIDSLDINTGRLLKFKGAGSNRYFEAYHSTGNHFKISNMENHNADLLVMKDELYSLKPQLGFHINGLIGLDFFKNNVVEIDYNRQNLIVYNRNEKLPRRIRKAQKTRIELIKQKLYFNTTIAIKDGSLKKKLLIDTGSSEALWLLNADMSSMVNPSKAFDDYLGFTMTGDIHGKRTKLSKVKIFNTNLLKVTTSIPQDTVDDIETKYRYKTGSIGGEILRRFNIAIDMKNRIFYTSPNSSIDEGFYYNMTGIHLIEGEKELYLTEAIDYDSASSTSSVTVSTSKKVGFEYIPNLVIDNIVPDSQADKVGLKKGDIIVSINRIKQQRLNLNKVTSYFYKNPYSTLKITVKRGEELIETKLKLIPLID